ncbi:MAG: hypothetical protein KDB71_11505 [Mycobacterium sp.]|nr:hypothetical protein [Mycobacterium sp.]
MKNTVWIDDTDNDGISRDAEKRWHDPAVFRAAVAYVFAVIALAAAAFAAMAVWHSVIAAFMVPGILFVGAVGALLRAYQVWRAEGVWVIWQGAGWVLVILFLFCLGVPTAVL